MVVAGAAEARRRMHVFRWPLLRMRSPAGKTLRCNDHVMFLENQVHDGFFAWFCECGWPHGRMVLSPEFGHRVRRIAASLADQGAPPLAEVMD